MKLPGNGQALLDARRRGERPEHAVVIALIPGLKCSNFMLYPDLEAEEGIDWSPLLGLDVEVVTDKSIGFRRLVSILADLSDFVPQSILLTFAEGVQVKLGDARELPAAADGKVYRLFDWWPESVGPTNFEGAEKLAKKLTREVGNALPDRWISTMDVCVTRIANGANAWQR